MTNQNGSGDKLIIFHRSFHFATRAELVLRWVRNQCLQRWAKIRRRHYTVTSQRFGEVSKVFRWRFEE